jgi:outer membrane protein assembly factor BamD
MFKRQLKLSGVFGAYLIVTLSSCKSSYKKLYASNDNAKKYAEAVKLFNNKDYARALKLFDPLVRRYVCVQQSDDVYYYYAYTNYKLHDYSTARYRFKDIAENYSLSPRAEECCFMSAYCNYLLTPDYPFDQNRTWEAIESLQYFINLYPKSDRVAEASKLIQNLRNKLEEKSYANSKRYVTIGDWQAAVISLGNTLRDYPDTKYAEELDFLTIRAQYEYAQHSRAGHQAARYNLDIGFARQFIEKYPNSKYLKEAKDYIRYCDEGIAKSKNILAEVTINPKNGGESN